jgi:hypothetical protein
MGKTLKEAQEIPEELRMVLLRLREKFPMAATKIWAWLDDEPTAVHQMIDVISIPEGADQEKEN